MSTDKIVNASGRTGPIAHDLGKIRVGRLPTINQDEYPGLSGWWVQLRIGEDGEEVLARVYGNTPEQAHSRATALAGQPSQALTQQTLDDVMAGIPARDAEIEALRKEIETLRAKQPVSCADGLADGEIDIADVRQYLQSWGCLAHPGVRALVDGYQSSTQPSGNSGEFPDAARVPLDSLHADAVYLLSRVKQETLSIHDAALSIQSHIDSAGAALAQQDADPLQGAADWLVNYRGFPSPRSLAQQLGIGYNRASRLFDAARKEQA